MIQKLQRTYLCAHPECPGYPYTPTEQRHPADTCEDGGRARAKEVLDKLDANARALLEAFYKPSSTIRSWADATPGTDPKRPHHQSWSVLVDVGVVQADWSPWRTPLGRECYVLLQEEIQSMTAASKPPYICIICNLPDTSRTEWCVDGVLFTASPGYGSRYDSTLLCEESLQIFVHDECLAEKHDAVVIRHQERVRRPDPTTRPWDPSYDCSAPKESSDS